MFEEYLLLICDLSNYVILFFQRKYMLLYSTSLNVQIILSKCLEEKFGAKLCIRQFSTTPFYDLFKGTELLYLYTYILIVHDRLKYADFISDVCLQFKTINPRIHFNSKDKNAADPWLTFTKEEQLYACTHRWIRSRYEKERKIEVAKRKLADNPSGKKNGNVSFIQLNMMKMVTNFKTMLVMYV